MCCVVASKIPQNEKKYILQINILHLIILYYVQTKNSTNFRFFFLIYNGVIMHTVEMNLHFYLTFSCTIFSTWVFYSSFYKRISAFLLRSIREWNDINLYYLLFCPNNNLRAHYLCSFSTKRSKPQTCVNEILHQTVEPK